MARIKVTLEVEFVVPNDARITEDSDAVEVSQEAWYPFVAFENLEGEVIYGKAMEKHGFIMSQYNTIEVEKL